MARVLKGTCEISLSPEDLRKAVALWIDHLTWDAGYRLGDVTLHPGRKYVLKAVLHPPAVAKAAAEASAPTPRSRVDATTEHK